MSPQHFDFTVRLELLAEADPQAPGRVLGLVATCNQLPESFESRLRDDGLLEITLSVKLKHFPNAERLAALARRIPAVVEAGLTLYGHNPKPVDLPVAQGKQRKAA